MFNHPSWAEAYKIAALNGFNRLQWIRRPGEELNLVYNDTVERDAGSLVTTSQEVALKLQYTIRF